MAEKANAKNGNAFIERYQGESNKLVAASGAPRKRRISAPTSRSGTDRIADLLRWSQEARSEGDGKTKSAGGGSGKRKGKGSDR